MGQVASIAGLLGPRLMADTGVTVSFLFMTRQAKTLFVEFEQRFAGRVMAIMTCQALAFDHWLVLTHHFHRLLFLTLFFFANRSRIMTVEADQLRRFGQEQAFVAGMYGMAADTLLVQVGFMDTVWPCHRFVMAVETELIGWGLGNYFLLLYLVAGITFSFCHRFVQIVFKEIGGVACMRSVALQAAALYRIVVMGLFKSFSISWVTGAASSIWFTG